ncbi:aldo-keto reductase family 1 member B10-like isoform X1 [Dermatophagoides pteronyssinus]|uniref:aldo-keto reductase family 1 member B10-like isoform X1 n=1 Tax=Dermatophagoides pteronyssinus TaxID=6956 RepID=UPI003F67B830
MANIHIIFHSFSITIFSFLLLINVQRIKSSVMMADSEQQSNTAINKTTKLKSGYYIPVVGLGTSRIASTDELVVQAIKDAIDVGYRHIDTADFYQNEKAIGQALDELIRDGKIKRNELFITTKVWSNYHTKELALQSVRQSLTNLRLDYLDLVLIHWPMSFKSGSDLVPKFPNDTIIGSDLSKENFELAYQGLEDACDQNLTRSIGVSNFNIKQLEKLLSVENRRHKPVVNQVECHPHLNQEKLLEYCCNNSIHLVAYSPLRRANVALFDEPKLKQIALEHNRTIAQIILRWQLQRHVIVIPRTGKKHRMLENISLFDFHLNQTEMSTIKSLDRSKNDEGREIKFDSASHLPEYPFVDN